MLTFLSSGHDSIPQVIPFNRPIERDQLDSGVRTRWMSKPDQSEGKVRQRSQSRHDAEMMGCLEQHWGQVVRNLDAVSIVNHFEARGRGGTTYLVVMYHIV